ncbi:MAG: hypothetical protein PHU44_17030 [Syntrophales bacterium]|nr:hypothetical protein [Syntrophales bacterium]
MKDKRLNELRIKIDLLRSVKKIGSGSYELKDKMFLIDIGQGGFVRMAFSVKASGNHNKDLRKVFRKIQEQIHIK